MRERSGSGSIKDKTRKGREEELSGLREVVALCVADLHLDERTPVARSPEPDWFVAMARPLLELKALKDKFQVPVLCAGDVFHRFNPSPAMINFALDHLPDMFVVAGNHDLKNHRNDYLEKCALWTLAKAGRARILKPFDPVEVPGKHPMRLWGFPWGVDPKPLEDPHDLFLEVALVHAPIWTEKTGHPYSKPEHRFASWMKKLRGYDAVVWGDNHKTILSNKTDDTANYPSLLNPGALLRRRADEIDHKPLVGLLHADGTFTKHHLDCSKDVFLNDAVDDGSFGLDCEPVIEALIGSQEDGLDFQTAVVRAMEAMKLSDRTRELILSSLEKK